MNLKRKTSAAQHHALATQSPDECLQMTADWYKIFCEMKPLESTHKFCMKQIAEYVEIVKRDLNWADKTGTRN